MAARQKSGFSERKILEFVADATQFPESLAIFAADTKRSMARGYQEVTFWAFVEALYSKMGWGAWVASAVSLCKRVARSTPLKNKISGVNIYLLKYCIKFIRF